MNEELRQKLNRHSCSSAIKYIEELEQERDRLREFLHMTSLELEENELIAMRDYKEQG